MLQESHFNQNRFTDRLQWATHFASDVQTNKSSGQYPESSYLVSGRSNMSGIM